MKVPNKDGSLKAGTPVQVSIESKAVKNALVVPKEAVLTEPDGKHTVMVVDSNDVAHQREVKTGISDDGKVQIVSGLKAGETVVTNGAYAMADGTKVKIENGGSTASQPTASGPGGGI